LTLLCWLTRCKGCGSLLHDSHAEVIARRNMLLVMLLREYCPRVTCDVLHVISDM